MNNKPLHERIQAMNYEKWSEHVQAAGKQIRRDRLKLFGISIVLGIVLSVFDPIPMPRDEPITVRVQLPVPVSNEMPSRRDTTPAEHPNYRGNGIAVSPPPHPQQIPEVTGRDVREGGACDLQRGKEAGG